jgi:hypothetical protein
MKQLTLFMALVITLTGCSQMTDKKKRGSYNQSWSKSNAIRICLYSGGAASGEDAH